MQVANPTRRGPMNFRKSEDERTAAREQRAREREQAEERSRAQRAQMDVQRAEQRQKREALRREQAARRVATTALPYLGVAVRDGEVFAHTFAAVTGRGGGPPLGVLAGAHAEVTGGKGGRRRSGIIRAGDAALAASVLGPVGLVAGASRKGFIGTAFVVFADGMLHEKQITDQAAFLKAQAEAVRFNALAAATSSPRSGLTPDQRAELDKIRRKVDARFANDAYQPVQHDGVCPDCGAGIRRGFGRMWDDDDNEHRCR